MRPVGRAGLRGSRRFPMVGSRRSTSVSCRGRPGFRPLEGAVCNAWSREWASGSESRSLMPAAPDGCRVVANRARSASRERREDGGSAADVKGPVDVAAVDLGCPRESPAAVPVRDCSWEKRAGSTPREGRSRGGSAADATLRSKRGPVGEPSWGCDCAGYAVGGGCTDCKWTVDVAECRLWSSRRGCWRSGRRRVVTRSLQEREQASPGLPFHDGKAQSGFAQVARCRSCCWQVREQYSSGAPLKVGLRHPSRMHSGWSRRGSRGSRTTKSDGRSRHDTLQYSSSWPFQDGLWHPSRQQDAGTPRRGMAPGLPEKLAWAPGG